jgi:transposase-like protein
MNQTPSTPRRKFDDTFRREAVNHWLSSGKSADVIANELGINSNQLYAWRQRFAPADAGGGAAGAPTPATLAEAQVLLDAAHRENRHLREQRDILKKTLGILSEPPPSAINGSTR